MADALHLTLTETRVTVEAVNAGIERVLDMQPERRSLQSEMDHPTAELATLEWLITEAIDTLEKLQLLIKDEGERRLKV